MQHRRSSAKLPIFIVKKNELITNPGRRRVVAAVDRARRINLLLKFLAAK